MRKNWILYIALILFFTKLWAWNSVGHKIIAQIAYDNMDNNARHYFSELNQKTDKIYKSSDWLKAAVWLDTLRYQQVNWYNALHYIDIPFSNDGSELPVVNPINAVWAIDNASLTLLNKYSSLYDKSLALKILLHVVGDLHQPLHAATKISKDLPAGDKGGNLYVLENNGVAHNLHEYWDRGAGLLKNKRYRKTNEINIMAKQLETQWPCQQNENLSAQKWAQESNLIAINDVYKMPLNKKYQDKAQKIVKQRLAFAGCRLGLLLNKLNGKIG